jgi:hypothetical protein
MLPRVVMAVFSTLGLRHRIGVLGCVLGAALAGRVEAQVVEIRPVADVSLPTRLSFKDGSIHLRQKVGLALGARVTLHFSDRFDVVTAVTYSPGYATIHGAGKLIELATGAHSLGTSASARYWIRPPGGKLSWELNGGLGMVFGGQPGYDDLLQTSTLSGVIGSTWVYQVGRIVSLKLKVQERLFRVQFGALEPGNPRPAFRVSLGLGFPILEALKSRVTSH